MKLTKNFSLKEFIESRFFGEYQERVFASFEADIGFLLPKLKELAGQLQILRDYTGLPISINIAYRPKWWEFLQGRSGNSKHVKCLAADIVIKDFNPTDTYNLIEYLIGKGIMKQGGLGKYKNFCHYDIYFDGTNIRRW